MSAVTEPSPSSERGLQEEGALAAVAVDAEAELLDHELVVHLEAVRGAVHLLHKPPQLRRALGRPQARVRGVQALGIGEPLLCLLLDLDVLACWSVGW